VHRAAIGQLAPIYKKSTAAYKEAQATLRRLQREAAEICDPEALEAEQKKVWDDLPSSVVGLEEALKAAKAAYESADVDESAPAKFEEAQRRYNAAKEKLENHDGEVMKKMDEMMAAKLSWEERLGKLVKRVDEKFQEYFEYLGGRAKVDVQQHTDFSKWSLALSLSFRRDAPPVVMSAHSHSGGEKALATMTFMLATQQSSQSSFRLVDEMNQGLDAENERRLFRLILRINEEEAKKAWSGLQALEKKPLDSVDATEAKDIPRSHQIFILSPKLLPRLEYNSLVRVHVIFNGAFVVPWGERSSSGDDQGLLAKRKRVGGSSSGRASQRRKVGSVASGRGAREEEEEEEEEEEIAEVESDSGDEV
jgi:hypothetical protein